MLHGRAFPAIAHVPLGLQPIVHWTGRIAEHLELFLGFRDVRGQQPLARARGLRGPAQEFAMRCVRRVRRKARSAGGMPQGRPLRGGLRELKLALDGFLQHDELAKGNHP